MGTCWPRTASRRGSTSAARMLPETSIARMIVSCCDGVSQRLLFGFLLRHQSRVHQAFLLADQTLRSIAVSRTAGLVTRLHGAVRAGGIGIVAASDIAIATAVRDVFTRKYAAADTPTDTRVGAIAPAGDSL